MSDLRYRSVEELRSLIRDGEAAQKASFAIADGLERRAAALEAEAARLREEAAKRRLSAHNRGQRIIWAKVYLARKEIPGYERITDPSGLPSGF